MNRRTVSQIFFGYRKKHSELDFVDVIPSRDVKLFLDPTLISKGKDELSVKANFIVTNYFKNLIMAFQNNDVSKVRSLLSHVHEKHELCLGYSHGPLCGKGKTQAGAIKSLRDLFRFCHNGVALERLAELPLFIDGVAEDCMSDILGNLLGKFLQDFSLNVATKYNFKTQKTDNMVWFWNPQTSSWSRCNSEYIVIPGLQKNILLVPKLFVRQCYFVNVEQYFRSVVAEMIQRENTQFLDNKPVYPCKFEIKNLEKRRYGNLRRAIIAETRKSPNLLDVHRKFIDKRSNLWLTDQQLDTIISIYLK